MVGIKCIDAHAADILVLLDGSGSVGPIGFQRALEFVNKLVDAFSIGPTATQMALVLFPGYSGAVSNIFNFNTHSTGYPGAVSTIFNFNTHSTAYALKNAVSSTGFPSGGENIPAALNHAETMFRNSSYGHRPSAKSIVILMTDGGTPDITPSVNAANSLKSRGVTVYTAGVGDGVQEDELRQVASNPGYYFNARNYSALENIRGPLTDSACTDMERCVCFNGGNCSVGNFGIKCACPAIYTGFFCEKPICEDPPCSRYGTCVVSGANWQCVCNPGYTDTRCTTDIDECSSSPCINGTCVDRINYFFCRCSPGFTGTICNIDINECDPNPCENGGSCTDLVNAFSCQCVPGYTGSACEININECASDLCENGGTCIDWVNKFSCDCPPRYYGTYCETGICQPSVADLVFILDSSLSQTEQNFNKQLDFIDKFISHIVIGENDFQVAVVTFSTTAKIEFFLEQYRDNTTLKEAVRNITFKPGATYTDKGLLAAKQVFQNQIRPYGKTAKRYAFVLTDGMSTEREKTKSAANELRGIVNRVISIGIGSEVSHSELLAIASMDLQNNRKYVYSVDNFNALYTVVKDLVKLACEECVWTTSSDILFVLDTSPSLHVNDFQMGLDAITYLIHKTTQMETVNNTVRVGLLTYGGEFKFIRSMNAKETKAVFLSSLQMLTQPLGVCNTNNDDCIATDLGNALEYSRLQVFGEISESSKETRRIVILLTDGTQKINEHVNEELHKIKTDNISLYSVALGQKADIGNLKKIVGDPALVFSLYDKYTLGVLDALTTEFFSSSCKLSNE